MRYSGKELSELQEYICDLCLEKRIPLEIHFGCLGDKDVFYRDDEKFVIACNGFYASNREDVKSVIITYIESIWKDESIWCNFDRSNYDFDSFNYRVAIHVIDVEDMDGWYNVVMGGSVSNR